jgi:MFS family permease
MKAEGRNAMRKEWFVVILLFVVAMLNYLDRTMIATMRSSIVSSIPMTEAQFGLLTSVFSWVYGAFCPIAGFIADRFKKTYMITGSLFVWSAVTLLTGSVSTYEELFVTRALMGISEAFFIPAALSMIMERHEKQSLAIGILFSGEMIGQSLGFLGGRIAERHSWNEAFYIFGLIGVLYAAFLIFTLKEPALASSGGEKKNKTIMPKTNIRITLKKLFGKRSFLYLLLIYPLPSIVSWMVMGWLPTYYQEQFQLSQGDAGVYATAYLYPASIIGLLLGGYLSDKWQKTNPYARILVPVIGFGVAAPCVFMIGYTYVLGLAVTLFLVYGFARMFIDTNLMPILCMVIDGRYRATGYGIINMFTVFAGGMSTYVTGALRDAHVSLSTVFQYASLGLMICMILLFLVKREAQVMNGKSKF